MTMPRAATVTQDSICNMRYRLANPRDFKAAWECLRAICGPVIATLMTLVLVVTWPLTGWIEKDNKLP